MNDRPLSGQAADAEPPHLLLAGAAAMAAGRLLTEAGYRWRSAEGGGALVFNAGTQRPAVLLLSEVIGAEDGLGLLARLREAHGPAELPVLFVACPGGALDEELALALGANDCVNQPVKPMVLLARVGLLYQAALARRAGAPASPSAAGAACAHCGGPARGHAPRTR